ncbi:hypothetical protein [Flammeovirga pacifica]|uniref:Uncharacterized protein n=1 Tax=Flammeovirga pacifica TaxID=915059 RepID=A0A1S1Z582_FLAPC|nr:hypothetical protein [Flammeovirga pacifica]OHX68313.1 hypothetical protein NH26_19150 [Flammeovirga pacifica]
MQFNRKLLITTFLGVLLFSCTKEEVESVIELTEDDLPSLNIKEVDYLRGTDTLEINLGEYANEQISIVDIKVSAEDKVLNVDHSTSDEKLLVFFDSKQLEDGEHNINLELSLNSELEIPSSNISQDILVDVDNYLPLFYIESDYFGLKDDEFISEFEYEGYLYKVINRTYAKKESFIIVDENLNPVSEVFDEDGSGMSHNLEIPSTAIGQNFLIYHFNSREYYDYAKKGDEVLTDSITDNRNLTIYTFPTQGEDFRMEKNNNFIGEKNDRTVVVAVAKGNDNNLEFVSQRSYSIESDDNYTYYSVRISDWYHSAENNTSESRNTVLIKDTTNEKGTKVILDFASEGDTIIVTKEALKLPTETEVDGIAFLQQCFPFNDLILVDHFKVVNEGNKYYLYEYMNLSSDKVSYFAGKEIKDNDNTSSFYSHVNSLNESFTPAFSFSKQQIEIKEDYISLLPVEHNSPYNIINSIDLLIDKPKEDNRTFYFRVNSFSRNNSKLTIPRNFSFANIEEVHSGKFKDFFNSSSKRVSFLSSSHFLANYRIDSFQIYQVKDL